MVELVVVIAVIGVLASSLIVLINPVTQLRRARDGTRKSDLSQIRSALELIRSDHGCYPYSSCAALTVFPDCDSALTAGLPPNTYMTRIPCDPQGGSYYYGSTGATYCLRACLENTSDTGRDTTNNFSCLGVAACPVGKVSFTLQNP